MGFLAKLASSADLMTGMMVRLGKAAYEPGQTPTRAQAERLRRMTLACEACPDQHGCAALQASCLTLDAAPAYCPNRAVFDQMPVAVRQ